MKRKQWMLKNKQGVNTVEVVILLAIVVGIALIFRDQMLDFVDGLLGNITGSEADLTPESIRNGSGLR